MNVINFKGSNCKNCYKCVRVCPVKSIRVKDEQAEIIKEQCVLCGACLSACHQNAKSVRNDVPKVKRLLKDGKKTVVSLAPSFIAAFEYDHPGQVVSALKRLGFDEVQETAIGAHLVSKEYKRLMDKGRMKNIITSACPTINFLIEQYYPDLIPYLAPVLSPMLAHGKLIKHNYGWDDTHVVFIGPCISKKAEADDHQTEDVIDGALTFKELLEWMDEEGISIKDEKVEPFKSMDGLDTRCYPIPRGILMTLNGSDNDMNGFHKASIDGIDQCMYMLDALREGQVNGYFIEMNACLGGCLKGPAMPKSNGQYFRMRQQLIEYAGTNTKYGEFSILDFDCDINLSKVFVDKSIHEDMPDEETISKILAKIGKVTKDQELNCGACGYPSCRDKAIAVYQGKAELYMCLPYMRERAESMSNVIIGSTPNVIIAVDGNMEIQEFNAAAEKMFAMPRQIAMGKKIYELIDGSDFEYVYRTHHPIIDKKVEYTEYGVITEQSIVYVEDQALLVAIFKDITKEQKQAEQIYKMRMDTAEMAQDVIEKQMMVAQEIASLLGETTAQTKVTLSKLKDLILYDGEDG